MGIFRVKQGKSWHALEIGRQTDFARVFAHFWACLIITIKMDRVQEHAVPFSIGLLAGVLVGFGMSRMMSRGGARAISPAAAATTAARAVSSSGRKRIGVLPP
jgi:hypothetical protein